MNKTPEKEQILIVLKQQTQPISLAHLLALLGGHYSERTLRRRLKEMADTGWIIQSGQKRGMKYQAKQPQHNSLFLQEKHKSLAYIAQPLMHRKPVSYDNNFLLSYKPNETSYLTNSQRNLLHEQGQRDTDQDPAGTYAKKIYNRLLIDLSYNSSRLEGNTYSLLDTKRLLFEGIAPENKLDEERIMILNHKEAIRYLVDYSESLDINFDTVCTIHYLLSDGLIPSQLAGQLRNHPVRISGSVYITLENQQHLKDQLELICQKQATINDPFEKSVFLLIHLAYLQAFADVNKRTSRLCCNIPLIKANLAPLSFMNVPKEDYINAMIAIYECEDTAPLAELYCYSYQHSCLLYDAHAEALGIDEVRVRYRQERRTLLGTIIREELVGEAMKILIEQTSAKTIPSEFQTRFIDTIYEDLTHITPYRIAGLGVTREELEQWKARYQKRSP